MQQQGSARVSTVSQGSGTRSLLIKSSRSLGATSFTVKQTADWKRALTVLPILAEHPPLSELKSGNQLDPECVIRTHQADSSASKAGALLCFVHLCM